MSVKLQILSCTSCDLHQQVTSPIPYSGASPNPFVVVGEAPGESENHVGEPFVGVSGQLLRKAIDLAFGEPGYADAFSYLNVVCCWPRGTPRPEHILACRRNLLAQLDILQPRYGIICGGVALNAMFPNLKAALSITAARGLWLERLSGMGVRKLNAAFYLPTWHPSAVLRAGGLTSTKGREFQADLKQYAEVALRFVNPATDDPSHVSLGRAPRHAPVTPPR